MRKLIVGMTALSLMGLYAPLSAAPTHRCDGVAATIVGTNGADTIRGTAESDVIVGLGGNDVISGLGEDDLICGNKGADRLYVHDSRSQCQTPADDYYFVDYLSGGKGNDKLYGDGYYVVMEGNKGNDLLDGCARIDPVVAVYTRSNNPVTVKLDKGFATGDGYDTLRSVNVVVGSQYGDLIVGTNHTEKIVDHSYSENLYGSGGNDQLRGRQGPDWLEGSRGDDLLIGRDGVAGNDELNGGEGADTCTYDTDDRVAYCES